MRIISPNIDRDAVTPGELESHAFRFPPQLSGSALFDLNSGADLSFAALKIPDVPAKPHVAPLVPERIKDQHLNEISPMGVVEDFRRVEVFDQHSVQSFILIDKTPLEEVDDVRCDLRTASVEGITGFQAD